MDKRDPALPAPLFIPALAFISGILLENAYPHYHSTFKISIALCSILSLLFLFINRLKKFELLRIILLLTLIAGLGYLRMNDITPHPSNHISSLLAEQDPIQSTFTGSIITNARKTANGYQYTLKLEKLASYPVTGNVLLFTKNDSLSYKDRVRVLLKIESLEPQSNPAMFDYREYLENRNIYGTGFAISQIDVIGKDPFTYNDIFFQLRSLFFKQIDKRFQEQAPFVKALIFGERVDLKEQTQVLTRGGLLHLIAISGMNILLIYGILFTLLNLFLPRIPVRIVLLFLMVLYAGLCSWTPSVIRAVVMIDLFLLAGIFERRIGSLQLIGASLLIIGVIDPTQIMSIGLQLSYACVIVLMLIFPKLSPSVLYAKESVILWKNILFKSMDVMILSILISIFIMPLTLFYFHQFGMNGIIGNMIGIPLVAALMPLAMLVIILPSPLWIPFHNSYTLLYNWFERWADFSGQLPFFWNYLYFPAWQFLLGLTSVICAVFAFQSMKRRNKRLLFSLCIIMLLPIIIVRHPVLSNPRLICFDVGVGDCALLQTPKSNVLFDTGPITGLKPELAYSVLPYFRKNGIHHLKYLILSHPHSDHIGGVPLLASDLVIDSVIVSYTFQHDPEGMKLLTQLSAKKNCHIRILADTTSFHIDDFIIHVIHPNKSFADENPNNEALVMTITKGKFKGIFTGDVEEEAESEIMKNNAIPTGGFTFIKVPHHGSGTSGNVDFIDAIHPKIAVINASLHNRFHFPNEQTVQTYNDIGTKVLVTGDNGAIQMDILDDYLKIVTWKNKKEFKIKL